MPDPSPSHFENQRIGTRFQAAVARARRETEARKAGIAGKLLPDGYDVAAEVQKLDRTLAAINDSLAKCEGEVLTLTCVLDSQQADAARVVLRECHASITMRDVCNKTDRQLQMARRDVRELFEKRARLQQRRFDLFEGGCRPHDDQQ